MNDKTVTDAETLRRKTIIVAALAVALVVLTVYTIFTATGPIDPDKKNIVDEDTTPSTKSIVPEEASKTPVLPERPSSAEQLAIFNSRKAGALSRIEYYEQQIAATSTSLQQAADAAQQMLVNDTGKRLAASDDLIEVYLAATEAGFAIPPELAELGQSLADVRAKINFTRGANELDKLQSLENEATSLAKRIEPLTAVAKERTDRIKAVNYLATQQTVAATSTLQDAIAGYQTRTLASQELELAQIRRQTRDQSQAAEQKEVAAFNERIAAAEREIAASKRRVEMAAKLSTRDSAAMLADRQALERQLQQDMSQIRTLLSPFISKGKTQHLFANAYRIDDDPTPRPVSLGRLRALGYLQKNRKSWMNLWRSTSAKNDRPLGSFPDSPSGHIGFDQALPSVQRAQALLVKYGDLLVDKGLLSP